MNNPKINAKSCLVVAPLNTVLNWVSEFEKWLGEDSDIEVLLISLNSLVYCVLLCINLGLNKDIFTTVRF